MKTNSDYGSNIFLTGFILLASMDFTALLEYALKAAIGGAIWLGYKTAADYIANRKNRGRQPVAAKEDDMKEPEQ